MSAPAEQWVILLDGREVLGPFGSEEACYVYAAAVRLRLDWGAVRLCAPELSEADALALVAVEREEDAEVARHDAELLRAARREGRRVTPAPRRVPGRPW